MQPDPPPSLSRRQIGAFVALWLGWSLGYGLVRASVDALLHSTMPHPVIALAVVVLALGSIWLGARLWAGWRGGLGLISIVFALFGALVGLVRRTASGDTPAAESPTASLVAIGVATMGSIVVGAVLLHAERLRRAGRAMDQAGKAKARGLPR